MDQHHHPDHHNQVNTERADQKESMAAKSVNIGHDHHKTGESHQAHDKHEGHHTGDFLKRFWKCLVLTIPVLALSHMVQQWFGFHLSFAGDSYVLLALGVVIYFYGGWPFLVGMVREIRYRNIGMMTLVALAISVAFIYSTAVTFGLKGMDFFWELA